MYMDLKLIVSTLFLIFFVLFVLGVMVVLSMAIIIAFNQSLLAGIFTLSIVGMSITGFVINVLSED